jgi:hypothetical protein
MRSPSLPLVNIAKGAWSAGNPASNRRVAEPEQSAEKVVFDGM